MADKERVDERPLRVVQPTRSHPRRTIVTIVALASELEEDLRKGSQLSAIHRV